MIAETTIRVLDECFDFRHVLTRRFAS